MFHSCSSGGSNFGDYSPFESSSSMDERSSIALEATLREHDEDLVITKSTLPKIRATYHISGMNLFGMKKAIAAWAPCPKTSRPAIKPTAKEPVPVEVGPHAKKLKRSDDSVDLIKGASPKPTLKPKPMPEGPRGEGSNRKKEKGVARPHSMRDVCWVRV
ncbi:hypothetical protein B296_00002997 [Ensete ventricosum]|uniref:Uncharacterized protein n=1 Tax=Ensete ventricosum TaxID=4639 RepID=A0A427A6I9_ENSVE|nr:hypothetical protein B296_00002997 [Ensete ventricosum]